MVRVAMLSEWHVHAKGYAREVQNNPETEIAVVWDNDVERGKAFADSLAVEFEADLDAVLQRKDVEAVMVNTPTNLHREVIIAAAKAGKHIFTEKVLALTVEDCRAIADAVAKAGVKFVISFPHRTMPHNLFAKQVMDEGLIGDINLLRIRNAHDGASSNWLPPHFYDPEACGGGAMMDLGAHGMYLARWLLGKPTAISAAFQNVTGHVVEDNAVALINFGDKAMAINETGFISHRSPFSLELYGTAGCLRIGGPDNRVELFSTKLETAGVNGWIRPDRLPKPLPSALEQWLDGILRDGPIHFNMHDATQLTELMEGAYRSHKLGQKVSLPLT